MKMFCSHSELGMSLLVAKDLEDARKKVRAEIGNYHASAGFRVHEATEDDIAWVSAMGGRVPKLV